MGRARAQDRPEPRLLCVAQQRFEGCWPPRGVDLDTKTDGLEGGEDNYGTRSSVLSVDGTVPLVHVKGSAKLFQQVFHSNSCSRCGPESVVDLAASRLDSPSTR
jgi:hypothetical protein